MLSLGQLVAAIHGLRMKIGTAKLAITIRPENKEAIVVALLDEIEAELERIAD